MLCGVLAGDDLRLSEIGVISEGLRLSFGERAGFELATVNDEETFAGRLAVVLMLFESNGRTDAEEEEAAKTNEAVRRRRKQKAVLGTGPTGRGRFNNAEPTIWNGEDLDVPTFIRITFFSLPEMAFTTYHFLSFVSLIFQSKLKSLPINAHQDSIHLSEQSVKRF